MKEKTGMTKMLDVKRENYEVVVKALPHNWSHPTEGTMISVMQWYDGDQDKPELIAQAIYMRGAWVKYQINEDYLSDEEIRHRGNQETKRSTCSGRQGSRL